MYLFIKDIIISPELGKFYVVSTVKCSTAVILNIILKLNVKPDSMPTIVTKEVMYCKRKAPLYISLILQKTRIINVV